MAHLPNGLVQMCLRVDGGGIGVLDVRHGHSSLVAFFDSGDLSVDHVLGGRRVDEDDNGLGDLQTHGDIGLTRLGLEIVDGVMDRLADGGDELNACAQGVQLVERNLARGDLLCSTAQIEHSVQQINDLVLVLTSREELEQIAELVSLSIKILDDALGMISIGGRDGSSTDEGGGIRGSLSRKSDGHEQGTGNQRSCHVLQLHKSSPVAESSACLVEARSIYIPVIRSCKLATPPSTATDQSHRGTSLPIWHPHHEYDRRSRVRSGLPHGSRTRWLASTLQQSCSPPPALC